MADDPQKSDRAIAADIGVSHETVSQARCGAPDNELSPERLGKDDGPKIDEKMVSGFLMIQTGGQLAEAKKVFEADRRLDRQAAYAATVNTIWRKFLKLRIEIAERAGSDTSRWRRDLDTHDRLTFADFQTPDTKH
jgi:hypothetical protein